MDHQCGIIGYRKYAIFFRACFVVGLWTSVELSSIVSLLFFFRAYFVLGLWTSVVLSSIVSVLFFSGMFFFWTINRKH